MKKIRLNLGCGEDIRKGFTNVDSRDLEGVDVVCDVSRIRDSFDEECADEIVAQDILEHLSRDDGASFLHQCAVVLKRGGRLSIRCPDINKVMNDDALKDAEKALFLYGGQDHEGNFHKWGYTQQSLRDALAKAGFEKFRVWDRTNGDRVNMMAEARK